MKLLGISPGYAKVSIKMKPQFVNFIGSVFGGIIACVADEAMAYATNSLDFPNIAAQFNINFAAGANANDELIAECKVIKSDKDFCVSEIIVNNQHGKLIASANGTTIPLGGKPGRDSKI